MNYGELIRARISTELLEQVRQQAERQNCNVSEIVRLALLAYTGGKVNHLECIAQEALEALAIIAMSYRVRIDRKDTPPYEFAQDVLDKLGVDLELTTRHVEQALAYIEQRGNGGQRDSNRDGQ